MEAKRKGAENAEPGAERVLLGRSMEERRFPNRSQLSTFNSQPIRRRKGAKVAKRERRWKMVPGEGNLAASVSGLWGGRWGAREEARFCGTG